MHAELGEVVAAVAELLGQGEVVHVGVVVAEQALGVGDQRVEVRLGVRQTNPALQYGDITVLGDRLAGNALVFLRHTTVPGEEALVIVNMDHKPLNVLLMLPYSHWYDGVPLRECSGNRRASAASSRSPAKPGGMAVVAGL